MDVNFDFRDRHVLVTGGSSGLGLATAHAFRGAGAQVTITGRKPAASDYPAENDLAGLDYVQCEMSEPDQVDALATGLSRLDVLVNNAGQNLVRQDEWNPDTFEEGLRINLGSVFRLSNACHRLLAASPHGGQ